MVNKKLECFIMSQLISAHIRIISKQFLPLCEHVTDCWSHKYTECKAGDAGFNAAAKFVYIFFSHLLLNYDQMIEKGLVHSEAFSTADLTDL